MDDQHPVALTSFIMKASERVILLHLQKQIAAFVDPFNLPTERAEVLMMLFNIFKITFTE